MDRILYNGYVIEPRPYELRPDGRWGSEFYIERHDGSGVTVQQYYGTNSHPTKDAAMHNCLVMAARIIDGRVPACSLP